ncbi:hypothetical protein Saro_3023 [Novosphingobium aromaticivorans DSM 12444]|uniref:Uncharacterized protein n=1 Tax=Novosphingobium aromaticivorans (strain ATCC 700278 / DSM 12444 / CCUG 56034 / CIP 105152 / NBRC 16084 / F199) TaxID=279238 RepID=Q2G3W5_NOVAD|nr:hypothetical protein [Novosphingobium aromaticivorans]ABD27458.1 hypothetical protein Saro_3023 [Novosphingobium aromaticivorans DSM 12444]SCY69837.1 hypothetical protein SAMN05660666_02536 [Novosphingobium aromaticivorans]
MRNPTIYIETDDGDEIIIVKREIMAETSVSELTDLLNEIRDYAEDLSVMFKTFSELGLSDHAKATKLGCYRQAEKWVEKRLKALGVAVEGHETERERSQARHITRLLEQVCELRDQLAAYEQRAAA